jgi:hypothetical protein
MIYIHSTHNITSKFPASLTYVKDENGKNERIELWIAGYEGKAKKDIATSIAGKVDCYLLTEPVHFESWHDGYVLKSTTKGKKTKAPSLDVLPDLWTHDLPLVTSRFKKLVERHDTLEHEFIPIKFYAPQTYELVSEGEYYLFACRRLVEFHQHPEAPLPGSLVSTGSNTIRGEQLNKIRMLQEHKDVQQLMESAPIWRDYRRREYLYFNETFFDVCREAELRGFKLSKYSPYQTESGRELGDVGYVKY